MARSRSSFRRLGALGVFVPFAMRQGKRMIAAILALILAAAATLTVPLAVRHMIDEGFGGNGAPVHTSAYVFMMIVVVVLAAASATRYYCVMTFGERVVADVRAAVFSHLTLLSPGFYDSSRAGELVSRLSADTTQIKSAFGASASIALRNFFMLLGAVFMMFITSPRLSGLVLCVIPLIVFPLVGFGRAVHGRSRAAQDELATTSAIAAEALSSMRTVQALSGEKDLNHTYASAVELAFLEAMRATRARSLLTGVAIFLVFACVVAVLWWGAGDVASGLMTVGVLGQFLLYAVLAAGALGELSQVSGEIAQAVGAAERLAELLRTQPDIVSPLQPEPLPAPVKGHLQFEQVGFAYPTRSDHQVLKTISADIKPGETVAIVGPSGAGKSTLLHLILRFYDVNEGRIVLDGVDIRHLDLHDLRGQIALVPQDSVIFATSIRDNIRLGRPDADDATIMRAARDAAADRFIIALPQGYDTLVGERGVTLSGGQRQRLAIARALLRNAPVLLLDEATSALDSENEILVQSALNRLMEGRTTLVVAHRLATVLKADRILVFEDGMLAESGTHTDLIAQNGLYARLAELQFGRNAIT
jgi:ATP-binding cassette subfamily B protein